MGIVENIIRMRDELEGLGQDVVPDNFDCVTKDKVAEVLALIDRNTNDMIDAVYALLDNRVSWFSNAPDGAKFRDGATTAHVGAHIGILQRKTVTKLDREGRDYWLKPLWETGAMEKVYLDSKHKRFLDGHVKAKSPNSAYRLASGFVEILQAPDGEWQAMLNGWIQKDAIRQRLELQASLAEQSRRLVDNNHSELIKASHEVYANRFLGDYVVIYIDDGDGDRITDEQMARLGEAGLTLSLGDAMPDVLLWNPETDHLWVIEAVTSDGEVDLHKKNSLTDFAARHGKSGVGFTTTYLTWKKAAERQGKLKNLANDSYVWIKEDPSRNIHIIQ